MQRLRPSRLDRQRHGRKRSWRCLVVVLVFAALVMPRPAPAELFDQYQVKAVFLFNLVHFIHWPAEADSIGKKTFTINVFGHDKVQRYLEKAVKDERIDGRPVVIRRCESLAELEQHPGDLLFVSDRHMGLWPQIRAIARHHHLLTVSDVQGFAHRSGMVNLVTSGRKIRIEINITETKANGFDISAKLLRLARIVHSEKDDR